MNSTQGKFHLKKKRKKASEIIEKHNVEQSNQRVAKHF